ncbi:PKD domain-containing protein [Thiocystis minor]|uniref:PKD domain-containing protein n=1 Tax=Thiocystis minor TaxID=61597 RepID=UPI001911AAFF|nr:hypothetical protein [Thiocystis minor]
MRSPSDWLDQGRRVRSTPRRHVGDGPRRSGWRELGRGLTAGALGLLLIGTASAQNGDEYTILLDRDHDTRTGCTVTSAAAGTFAGVDRRLVTTVTGTTVTAIRLEPCISGTWGTATWTSAAGWPVGVGLGLAESSVIETSLPRAALGATSALRLGVLSPGSAAEDALFADGNQAITLNIPPAVSATAAIPTLSPPVVFFLALLLAGIAGYSLRQHRHRAQWLLLVGAVTLTSLVWAAFQPDGKIGDWQGIEPLATQSGSVTAPTHLVALFAQADSTNLHFRIDAGIPPACASNQAPQVNAGGDQTITLPASATLDGTATDDGCPVPPGTLTLTWSQTSGPGTASFANDSAANTSVTFTTAGDYVLRLTASDGVQAINDELTVTVESEDLGGLPPDPARVAPVIDPTVATTHQAATQFLYTGANPIQTGVAEGTIDPVRSALLRGRVLDRDNQPLPGVTVTVLNHPEFGQTLSRADGWFDLAVNGGGYLTVNYAKDSYLSSQRQSNVPWQDSVVLDDVVLIGLDPQVTTIDLADTTQVQVARGSVQTDDDGSRQATLLFPPGTQASMVLPDGSTQPMTTLSVRATEFTVGPNGPRAMPAALPPNVAYTYAVDLNADEARAAGATKVTFAQPVPFYVENFLGFPVGTGIPLGYYNEERGVWEPYDNGITLKILRIVDGLAELDTNGDNLADTGTPALAITEDERRRLADLYAAGQTLWRVLIPHFSAWDSNQATSCSDNTDAQPDAQECSFAEAPKDADKVPDLKLNKSCEQDGSTIECENQTLGETLPLAGTGLTLNYRSDRVPGRAGGRTLEIPLTGATLPTRLGRIVASVTVGGRRFELGDEFSPCAGRSFAPAPNLRATFIWDGKDQTGRPLYGAQPVTVDIVYRYPVIYQRTSRFGYDGEGRINVAVPPGGNCTRVMELKTSYQTQVVGTPLIEQMIGGWSLDAHHVYDPIGKVLYLGDGTQRSGQSPQQQNIITTIAGTGAAGFGGDGGPAKLARLNNPSGMWVTPDGSLLIADQGNHRIRRINPSGIISTIAGTGTAGFSGDGGLAIQAQLNAPEGVKMSPDGSIVIADTYNHRIRRVSSNASHYTQLPVCG